MLRDKSRQIRSILQQNQEFAVVGQIRDFCESPDGCEQFKALLIREGISLLWLSE